MLDDHLFSVDLERWKALIATERGGLSWSYSMEHTMMVGLLG